MIVDSHAHLSPQSLINAIRRERSRFPSVRVIEEGDSIALAFGNAKPTRPVSKGLSDVSSRIAWMNDQRIDRQVVGGWVDSFGYELPPAEGEAWSRLANEAMLSATRAEPRLVPLATVPLQDGQRAGAVLKAAMRDGFAGAMIGTLPRGIGSTLDSADLDPFWAAADDAGAVVLVHPSYDAGDLRVGDYGLANAIGRVADAMVAVGRLVCSGHMIKYSNARICVPMGGAGLPFLVGRLKRNYKLTRGVADPVEALSRLYVDTIVHDPRVLKFVIEMLGADRLVMGSDMPFPIGDQEPMRIIQEAAVSDASAASINGGLAARLFRLA